MSNWFSGKMPDLIINIGASIVFGVLLWAGGWLVSLQVSDETSLQYKIHPTRVGPMSVWHIQLQNTTKYAFALEFKLPSLGIVRTSFSLPSTATEPNSWKGVLHVGKPLEALIVADDPQLILSGELLSRLIQVSYEDRDPTTGSITKREATLQEASAISISRSIGQYFWLCLPFVGFGLILWVVLRLGHGKGGMPAPAGGGTKA
jgi:hypothetical protein